MLENLNEENQDDLLVELQFSTLPIPINEKGDVPIIRLDNELYVPLFTDMEEFNKSGKLNEFQAISNDFDFYLKSTPKNQNFICYENVMIVHR